jgi:hypothetical protein
MQYGRLLIGLVLISFISCGQAVPPPAENSAPRESPTPIAQASPSSLPPASSDLSATAPAPDEASAPDRDASIVRWQGLQIPLPHTATWNEETPSELINGFPVVARGSVIYAGASTEGAVEQPTGPIFTIVNFDGSVQDWLDLERKNATSMVGNTVDEPTIRETTIAGLPAITYQRAVIGTGNLTYAIVDLDGNPQVHGDRLLLITSDAAFDANNAIITGLTRTTE